MAKVKRERLDKLLVELGYFETRSQARGFILAGEVFVDGERVDKPGTAVSFDAAITVKEATALRGAGWLQTGGGAGCVWTWM
jgi:predicted rRNA methylase YqxC with S4 and FtsJ domains